VSKIISKCCELVKLCHINCSGPVFFETHSSTVWTVRSTVVRSFDRMVKLKFTDNRALYRDAYPHRPCDLDLQHLILKLKGDVVTSN